jgi:osmotically-inducible protein OsmY
LQDTKASLESDRRFDLQRAVERAIWKFGQIRPNLPALNIAVSQDGIVEISGPVRSSLTKEGILQVTRRVPGVTRVVDGLISDSELQRAVADALAENSKTRDHRIFVHSHMGLITLVGGATSKGAHDAAERAAGEIPGVLEVINRLS